MHSLLKSAAVALGPVMLVAALAGPAAGQAPPPPYDPHPVLSADLGLGGTGHFDAVDDRDKGQLCYMLFAAGVQNPTGAFIGDGKSNASVLALQVPVGGTSGGCVDIGKDLADKLVDHAGDYSVYVQSTAYPNGVAAAGRLMAQIPDKPVT
jgi:hypothetical protein